MVEISDLDGVGPARSDSLVEAGYEDVDAIAEADPEQLAEDIGVPDDTALDFVVQAQNAVEDDEEDESEAESDSSPDVEEDTITNDEAPEAEPEAADDNAEDEAEPEAEDESLEEDDEPDVIEFSISFGTGLEYDTFYDSALETRANYYRTNRTGVEAYEHTLEQLRNGSPDEDVDFEFTPAQLNDLHNAIRERKIQYKGDNLIDHMDALDEVLQQIEAVRNEHLF